MNEEPLLLTPAAQVGGAPPWVTEELARAAYRGCFTRYGHPSRRDLDKAWRWLAPESRAMWYDVAAEVLRAAWERE